MTIDPRWSIFLSLSLAILAFLGSAGSQFADLGLQPHTVKAILALITLVLGIGNAVNAVLAGIPAPNSTTGFLIKPPVKPEGDK